MLSTLPLLLAALQAAPSSGPDPRRGPVGPFEPDTVFAPPRTPLVVQLRAPGSELVALRLSIPLEEAPAEAGAARVLQLLAVRRANGRASPVGIRVEGARTPWGLSYSVVGPAADFDYLAYLIRAAASEPDPSELEFQRARAVALGEVHRADETAVGRLVSELQEQVRDGEAAPLVGTEGTLAEIGPATLRDLWMRTHQAERMRLVVVGDVVPEVLLSAFQGVGTRAGTGAEPPDIEAAPPRRGDVQTLRTWYGEARIAGAADEPLGAVAAVLVADRLRDRPADFEAEVQLWEMGSRRYLAVMGGSYRRGLDDMRARVRGILGETRSALDDEAVWRAVARVRHGVLVGGRTPGGLASMVGRYLDATGDPRAADRFLGRLDEVTTGVMRRYMADLADRTPLRAEVRR